MLAQALRTARRRIGNLLSRAQLTAVSDDGGIQTVQIALLADEAKDGVERLQTYGFTSHPFAGAEGLALFPGGSRSHGIAICMDDRRYRLTGLEAGEVAIYDDQGQILRLTRNGIVIEAPLGLTINGDVTINGNTLTNGDAVISGECTISGIAFTPHTHSGVDPGPGNTGAPN